MPDTENVQTETTLEGEETQPTEAVSAEAEKTQPRPQTLPDEAIAQIVEQVSQRVLPELAKRSTQSARDSSRAEIEQALERARQAEGATTEYRQKLDEIDPESADKRRIAELEQKLRQAGAGIYQEQKRRQAQVFADKFTSSRTQSIKNLGVDPNDKRIDWAPDAKDYFEADSRIFTSVAKIQKEDSEAQAKRIKQEAEDKLAKEREEANSVDTSASGGAGGSDAEFLKKFGAGEVPYSKENAERAQKILNK